MNLNGIICVFKEHPRVVLAFPGGVDSAYLLYFAIKSGEKSLQIFESVLSW